jgi:hypothetical protein
MGKHVNGSARIPKRHFYAIVEQSYREGIGARRLSRLIGYSSTHIRKAARILELPKLPRYVADSFPSHRLITMISAVEHLRVYAKTDLCVNSGGTVRPQET